MCVLRLAWHISGLTHDVGWDVLSLWSHLMTVLLCSLQHLLTTSQRLRSALPMWRKGKTKASFVSSLCAHWCKTTMNGTKLVPGDQAGSWQRIKSAGGSRCCKPQEKTQDAPWFWPTVNSYNSGRMIWYLKMFTLCIWSCFLGPFKKKNPPIVVGWLICFMSHSDPSWLEPYHDLCLPLQQPLNPSS